MKFLLMRIEVSVEIKESDPAKLLTEDKGLLSRVCLIALLRSSLKTSKLFSQAFDKKVIKLPVRRFLPV